MGNSGTKCSRKDGNKRDSESFTDFSDGRPTFPPITEKEEEWITQELAQNQSEWFLSDDQKKLLRDSWFQLQSNIESVGTVTFLKMFETHPETLKPFIPEVDTLRELELNEWYRENLKVHAIRVMAVIEKTMHRLDDEKRAAMILFNYGRRHHGYGVTKQMLEKMAHSFLVAIQPSLEESWNKKVEESWLGLFRRITYFMQLGYPEIETNQDHRDVAHNHNNKESSSKRSSRKSLLSKKA